MGRVLILMTSRYQASLGIAVEASDLAEEYLGKKKSTKAEL